MAAVITEAKKDLFRFSAYRAVILAFGLTKSRQTIEARRNIFTPPTKKDFCTRAIEYYPLPVPK